jgi:GH25 family lysozyme M1 (1,4-beta-N-acetylmuramidase)
MKMTDSEYQQKRNRLIPAAERHANKIAGPKPKSAKRVKDMTLAEKNAYVLAHDVWSAKWNNAYHTEMDALAKEAVLI